MDVRGAITGHRARATIATQLYNATDPMSLSELQAWLGQANPSSTQHYARITPLTLTKAYTRAGYFARNIRTIEVLLDRDAITNGSAGSGGPFEFYDLAHGYCTYTFFEQCPHRMACARCDFYLPKESSQAQLLEAKDGLQRLPVQIPLTDTERAAVEVDSTAIDRLLASLAETPTPTGDGLVLGCDPRIRALRRGRAMIAPPSRAALRHLAGKGRVPSELLAQQFDIHPEVAEHARELRVTRERAEQIAHAEGHASLGQRQAGAHHQHALQRRVSCRPNSMAAPSACSGLESPSRRQPREVHGPTGHRSRDAFLDRQANACGVRPELLQDLAGATVCADNPEQQVLGVDVLAPRRPAPRPAPPRAPSSPARRTPAAPGSAVQNPVPVVPQPTRAPDRS